MDFPARELVGVFGEVFFQKVAEDVAEAAKGAAGAAVVGEGEAGGL